MNIADLRFTECAYFYKLKDGATITDANIHDMLVDVTTGKMRNYLFDIDRQDGGSGTQFSLRVFKQKKEKPTFFLSPEPGWEEIKVGYFLFIECDRYVAVLKRYANVPKTINEKLENVDYTTLMALETRLNSVFKRLSIQNLDGSDYAMRNKTYESQDLSNNISTVGISRYFIRSVSGKTNNDKFSLTLSTSKVNEFGADMTVRDICGWVRLKVDEIAAVGVMPDTLLSAFAMPEDYVTVYSQLQPISVLVFSSLVEMLKDDPQVELYHTKDQGQRSLIDKQTYERYIELLSRAYTQVQTVAQRDGSHFFVGRNNSIEIRVTRTGIRLYNKTWRNISIEGSREGEYDGDLQSLINNNHQFNVYFTDRELVYNNRTLFRDSRLLSSVTQFVKVLKGLPALNGLLYEKYQGRSPQGLTDWHPRSIFKMVERDLMPSFTYFICDDCNDEWADHIGISPEKVSFFVSKHKTSKDSASDFQDVVGQALKNLGNLSPSRAQLIDKAQSWADLYQTSNLNRFRSPNGTVQDAVDMWQNNVMSPNFTREMCLVVDFMEARTFSNQLTTIANGGHVINSEALFQRLWILSSYVNGCLEVGVKPVIFCKD